MPNQPDDDIQASVKQLRSELQQLRTDVDGTKSALGAIREQVAHQPRSQYHDRVKRFQSILTICGILLFVMLLAVLAYSYWSASTSMSSNAFTLCILGVACLTVLLGMVIVVLGRLIDRH